MKKSYEKPLCEIVVFDGTDCLKSTLSIGKDAVASGSWNDGKSEQLPQFGDW